MKYLRYFKTKAEYDAAVAEGLALPNVSYVEGDGVYYAPLVAEVKSTIAGDIAYWDGSKVVFCASADWQDSLGTPIGVVVVPSSHREDGKSVIMSLANMSLKTPETGSLAQTADVDDNYMMWGDNNKDLSLTNYQNIPLVDPTVDPSEASVALSSYGYLPSDIFATKDIENLTDADGVASYLLEDSEGFYSQGDTGMLIPSPYLINGSKNPMYYYENTATNDTDGKANTDVIVNAISAQYKGDLTVENVRASFPAANCASRYHTVGTNAGDWYLPSMGELGYLWVRLGAINNALEVIGEDKAVLVGDATTQALGYFNWSSTEYSQYNAWYLYTTNGYVSSDNKGYNLDSSRVRAFCAL